VLREDGEESVTYVGAPRRSTGFHKSFDEVDSINLAIGQNLTSCGDTEVLRR